MNCPRCDHALADVTDSWHTFAEAEGAEYLATYVTIWHCSNCGTVVGTDDDGIAWVMEPDKALAED